MSGLELGLPKMARTILKLAPAALICAAALWIALSARGSDQTLSQTKSPAPAQGEVTHRPDSAASAAAKPEKPAATAAANEADSWELCGTVVNDDGKPAPQASITVHNFPFVKTIRPAADGSFVVTVPNPPRWNLAIFAQEENGSRRAAFLRDRQLPEDSHVGPVQLVLKKSREIAVLVTDNANRPVEGATAGAQGNFTLLDRQHTDRQGRATLRLAASLPLQDVFAFKAGDGLDYCHYHSPDEPVAQPGSRPQDDAKLVDLKLAGARTVHIRVTQTGGRPVAGVRIRPWFFTLPKKGSILNLAPDAIEAVTDRDGTATFAQVPTQNQGTIIFNLFTQDYFVPKRLEFEPASKTGDLAAVVVPWEHVGGKVIFASGRSGRGAKIAFVGGGYQSEQSSGETKCDEAGRFEARLAPNQFVLFRATSGRAISEVQTRIIRAGLPTKPLNLVLEPATRACMER